jgi:two-component system response regulator (stage 0 sporulation protein F)
LYSSRGKFSATPLDHMKKLLIVDDEILILRVLSKAFCKDGELDVITASNGESALKAISANRIDLCLLDVHLPDMNGLEIMKQIRKVAPETRIVIITGSDVTDSMMKYIRENAHSMMSKPFELDEIRLLVSRLLATDKTLHWDA